MDYAGECLNMSDDYNTTFLKSIESGAGLHFKWIYEDNSILKETDYDDMYSVNYEYWLDDQGQILLNKWGDKAVKHYYKDSNGYFYLDDNGEKIVIPINDNVEDIRDPDFEDHYLAGYYKTGVLVIPDEDMPEGTETGEETDG